MLEHDGSTARPDGMVRRVLLSRMPRILHDILEHAIVEHRDLQLLGRGAQPWIALNGHAPPDVVVVAPGADESVSAPLAILREWPDAHVIVLTPDEGDAIVYRLTPQVTNVGRVSPTELIQVVRGLGSPRGAVL